MRHGLTGYLCRVTLQTLSLRGMGIFQRDLHARGMACGARGTRGHVPVQCIIGQGDLYRAVGFMIIIIPKIFLSSIQQRFVTGIYSQHILVLL
jgi:hypothetical protein